MKDNFLSIIREKLKASFILDCSSAGQAHSPVFTLSL